MASDPRTRVTARARVQITVEILVDDSWGEDCPVSQIHRQAKESALGVLARMRHKPQFSQNPFPEPTPLPFTVVGEAIVTTVLLEQPRS